MSATPLPTRDSAGQAATLDFIQNKFSGGLNRLEDSTQIGPDEYPLLINGRNRLGTIKPIASPVLDMIGLPANLTRIQGLYTAGNYGLVFADGAAFYKDYAVTGSIWTQIVGLAMSAEVETIYVALVESSTVNFTRKLNDEEDVAAGVSISGSATTSPRAVVVQDGINQPWIILPDASARVTQSYGEWSQENREYVPIGSLMMYDEENGILYIYDSSKKLLYRSVSGRPLDFVINITPTGDKGGDATTTAHPVSFDQIGALQKLNFQEGGFYAATPKISYRVTPDFADTAFGEPFLSNKTLFDIGAINHFSIIDLLGDTVFINYSGITSFNAVEMYRNEGRNSPFSQRISAILEDILQDKYSCVGKFDNYGLFSVQTIYGPAIIVFDELRNTIIALDIFSAVSRVIQFAEIKTLAARRLLIRTLDHKIYEAYPAADVSEAVETVKLYLGDWTSGNPRAQLKPNNCNIILQDILTDGTITAQCFVDGKAGTVLTKALVANKTASTNPVTLPFGDSSKDSVYPLTLDFSRENQGWKVGIFLTWNVSAKLNSVLMSCNTLESNVALEQQARISKQVLTKGGVSDGSKAL